MSDSSATHVADRGTVERDGFHLDWVREGQGTPLLIVGAERYYRRAFPQELRRHFEIVFCDLREWAPTPAGFDVSTITKDTFSDDIEAIRGASGLDRPVVMGHSHHGNIAIEYARRYPDRVRGAVSIAGSLPPGEIDLQDATTFFDRDASSERKAAHARNLATRHVPTAIKSSGDFVDMYVANGARMWYDPDFDSTPFWEGVDINLEVVAQMSQPQVYGIGQVEPVEVPTLIVLGRYDYGAHYYLWEGDRKAWPNLEVKVFDRSGHHPQTEQPDEFVAEIVAWAAGL